MEPELTKVKILFSSNHPIKSNGSWSEADFNSDNTLKNMQDAVDFLNDKIKSKVIIEGTRTGVAKA